MMKTVLFAAAAALATAATAAPVLAKDVVVRYGDLDLTTSQGQRTLSQRLNRAARVACEFRAETGIPSHEAVSCYNKARAKASSQMATLVDDRRLGG